MTYETDTIVLDILKGIQDRLGRIERKVDETNERLIVMDGHMASFHTTQAFKGGALGDG